MSDEGFLCSINFVYQQLVCLIIYIMCWLAVNSGLKFVGIPVSRSTQVNNVLLYSNHDNISDCSIGEYLSINKPTTQQAFTYIVMLNKDTWGVKSTRAIKSNIVNRLV